MMRTLNKRLAGALSAMFLSVIIPVLSAFPVSAAEDLLRIADMADLLSDSEEAELSDLLDEISERQQVDVVVVTVDSMEGDTAEVYADDFYDYNGYGFGDERDGVLLLVSMEDRDWHITTRGYGITAVTDAGREYMAEIFLPDLSAGDYAAAFTSFANLCDDFITQAKTEESYEDDPVGYFVGSLVMSFVIAFVISLIVTGIMRMQMNSVHSQSRADNYMKPGSMQLTKKNDLFLYKHINRTEKVEDTSSSNTGTPKNTGGSKTHVSSSGATHGGGGGKF